MTIAETGPDAPTYDQLVVELGAERELNGILEEAMVDLELAADDRGWRLASTQLEQEFSRQGLERIVENCRVAAIASPLIKRGLGLRVGYVWGQGVSVQARATGTDNDSGTQDVNAVVQAFWDDESNQKSLTSSEAAQTNEWSLGTDGQIAFAFFTDPVTGRVQVRTTPFQEITDKITNPDDRDQTWFYLRQYTTKVIEPGYSGLTRSRTETRRVLHPDLRFWPAQRPKSIDGIPVAWDQPVLHVTVNRPAHWKWGIPDVYASLPWARAYEGILTDWTKLVKALSKFAWRLTGDKSTKASAAAAKLTRAFPTRMDADAALAGSNPVGAVAAMGPGVGLEAIPKTGATIDADAGKPLASLVAAGLGVSIVDLLADPGVTGARAVAETMGPAIVGGMNLRRAWWRSLIQTITTYVIQQSVRAPRGALAGTVTRDPRTGVETFTLAGDTESTVEVVFPDLNELDPVKLVGAIVDADSTKKLGTPKLVSQLLLQALQVDDVDELLNEMFDENGQWLDGMDAEPSAGAEAMRRFRRGEDPADADLEDDDS